jgi:hypothetical protein
MRASFEWVATGWWLSWHDRASVDDKRPGRGTQGRERHHGGRPQRAPVVPAQVARRSTLSAARRIAPSCPPRTHHQPSSVPDLPARCRAKVRTSVIETRSGAAATLHASPSAAPKPSLTGAPRSQGTADDGEASRSRACPPPTPTLGPTRSRASPPQTPTRPRPEQQRTGTPGAAGVQLPGAAGGREEGRQPEQQQTGAILEMLAWLAAHPPTSRTATAGTATSADTGAAITTGRSTSGDTLPTMPMPDGPGRSDRPPSPDDRPRRSRSRVVPGRGPSPRGGAGRRGPAARGGRLRTGRGPGGGAPLGMASLAPMGGSSRPAGGS